jgi:hypothetical protein
VERRVESGLVHGAVRAIGGRGYLYTRQ